MNYGKNNKEVIYNYILRTRENYFAIKKYGSEFEVTQLINSLIGLLIIPNEAETLRIIDEELFLDEELIENYPQYYAAEVPDAREFIRHLRNAVAHYGITFKGKKSIEEIEFRSGKEGYKHSCSFKVKEFETFVLDFSERLCNKLK